MRYTFAPIERAEAEAIAGWSYDGPYSLYDGDPEGFETTCARVPRALGAR